MITRPIIVAMSCLLFVEASAQEVSNTAHSACQSLTMNDQSIPTELKKLLGDWDECNVEYYEEEEFGLNALIVVKWPSVTLSLRYQPPESSRYTVQVSGDSPLTSQWYEENQTNLVDKFFRMDWSRDEFPGPTSEYYVSPKRGANGQFWVERDKDGNVTWMRFSYAL